MEYDVIVCGGGPGGSSAAYALAKRGRKVAFVDKDRFPRDKPCGGLVRPAIADFPEIMREYEKFGEGSMVRVAAHSASGKHFFEVESKSPIAYHVRRRSFDDALARMAERAGAQFVDGKEVEKVKVDDKVTFALSDGSSLVGKVAIGAGGVHCPVAKRMRAIEGLEPHFPKEDMGVTLVAELDAGAEFIQEKYPGGQAHFFLGNYMGYRWVFPKRTAINFGVGIYWKDAKRVNISTEGDRFKAELRNAGMLPKRDCRLHGGLVPIGGTIARTYSDRLLVVGDSAGQVCPLTGDGIYYAILAGRLAGETIDMRLSDGKLTIAGLGAYEAAWKNEMASDIKNARALASFIFGHPEKCVEYASRDDKLREMFVHAFAGTMDLGKIKRQAAVRFARHAIAL